MPFIPLEVYANNPATTAAGSSGTTSPASGTVETWTVVSSAGFPVVELGATQFHVADPAQPLEMITVQNVAGTTWTVMRGAESTTPVAHGTGATYVQVVTAGALTQAQYPLWQFPVQAYQAQGDGKIGSGGTGTSGTNTFTDAGASFVNAAAPAGDVGKYIIINQGAGSATVPVNPFCGTIIAVNSATSVTLSANLAANAASAPYIYGTDDSAAISAAITAAAQWAVATGNYKAQVIFEPQNYMLGTLTQTTTKQWPPFNASNYIYNTHIPLPFATQFSRKLVIDLIGTGSAAEPDFWGGTVPALQGTCLVSAVFATGQPDGTFGQMSVIGTPSSSVGIGNGGITGGAFGNALVNVHGITCVTPYNSQIYGFDLRTCAQANIDDGAAIAFAPVNFSAQTVGGPWLRSGTIPGNGVAVGLAMPVAGNNDNCNVGRFSSEGFAVGIQISEHFTAQRIACMYCGIGIQVEQGVGIVIHGGSILFWSCEGSTTGLKGPGSGQYPIFIGGSDFEAMITNYVDDVNNTLAGVMYWADTSQATPVASVGVNGAAWLSIINTRLYPGPWAANATFGTPGPPAAPATSTAQQNTSYRNAVITAAATTGITAYAAGPASGTLTTISPASMSIGANTPVAIPVPSGHWYSVTYTGTLSTKWVLE